ncbi:MAG: MBL fold metallo-hydrolase [Haloplanus sp.]
MAHELGESDWGDWLPTAVADADPDGVAIWYLGCNGFVLKGSEGTTILIDPYCGLGDPPRTVRMIPVPFDPTDVTDADAILATHEHPDHVHGPTQAPILAATGAEYYAPDASMAVVERGGWIDDWSITAEQFVTVTEDESFDVGEFIVNVVTVNDPDADHPVGYVIEHEAGTVFHGGDTRPDDSFADVADRFDIDLGVLALGSAGRIPDKETRDPTRTQWYADENAVIRAANALELDRLLPSHWDMWKGLTTDPTVLHHHAASFDYPERLEVVEIGDRVDL